MTFFRPIFRHHTHSHTQFFRAKLDLEKFRTDRRVIRKCGICGFENHRESIRCDKVLMEVEILSENQITLEELTSRTDDETQRIEYALRRRVLIEVERVVRVRRQDLTLNEYRMNARSWNQGDILDVTLRRDGFTPRHRLRDWVTKFNLMSGLKHANRLKFEGPSWFFGELPSYGDNDDDPSVVTVRLYVSIMSVPFSSSPCSSHTHTQTHTHTGANGKNATSFTEHGTTVPNSPIKRCRKEKCPYRSCRYTITVLMVWI